MCEKLGKKVIDTLPEISSGYTIFYLFLFCCTATQARAYEMYTSIQQNKQQQTMSGVVEPKL